MSNYIFMSYKVSNYVKEWIERRLRRGHLNNKNYTCQRNVISQNGLICICGAINGFNVHKHNT